MIRRPQSKLTVNDQRTIEGRSVAGTTADVFYEERFTGPQGPGGTRLIAGAVDEMVFVMDFSSLGDLWPWDDVSSLATLEVEKIRTRL
jgi:hypothetical protein